MTPVNGFDIEQLRVPHHTCMAIAPQSKKPPTHRSGQPFLKGPVPWPWLESAARLPGKALAVGLVIWHLAGLTKKRTIKWQPKKAAGMGMSRHSVYRAIKALEAAGLASVQRHPGRSPVITILEAPSESSD